MADTSTVFGSVNAIILQGANTAKNLKNAFSPRGLEEVPTLDVGYTTQEKIAIGVGVAIIALVIYLVWKEA